jgi:hypothetical protein
MARKKRKEQFADEKVIKQLHRSRRLKRHLLLRSSAVAPSISIFGEYPICNADSAFILRTSAANLPYRKVPLTSFAVSAACGPILLTIINPRLTHYLRRQALGRV